MTAQGLLDTNVFVARESGRPVVVEALPDRGFVSVITIAELHAGVLAAPDLDARHRRLGTLHAASELLPLPVTYEAALSWARLRARLLEAGRRVKVNDLWIAAVALAHDLPVVTQDDDFVALEELALLEVVRV